MFFFAAAQLKSWGSTSLCLAIPILSWGRAVVRWRWAPFFCVDYTLLTDLVCCNRWAWKTWLPMSLSSPTGCWWKVFPLKWRLSGGFDPDFFPVLKLCSGKGSTLSSPWLAWECSTRTSWTRSSAALCRPSPPGTSRCSATRASLHMASPSRALQLSSSLRYWPAITRMNSVPSCSLLQVHVVILMHSFTSYVLGCPRLPIGSFKSLTPPLTIVKKSFDTPEVKLICVCNL